VQVAGALRWFGPPGARIAGGSDCAGVHGRHRRGMASPVSPTEPTSPVPQPDRTARMQWFECEELLGYTFDEYRDWDGVAVFRHPTKPCATVSTDTGHVLVHPLDP
jgi:hypothetical protein